MPLLPFLLDPHSDLQEEAAKLRSHGTVVPAQWPGGVDCWAVVGYQELETVLTQPDFARSPAHWRALNDGEVPADWPMLSHLCRQWMLTTDGADHTRLRRFASGAFTARRVAALRPSVSRAADRLLDQIDGTQGPFDLRGQYALPLALDVLCSLLGLPPEERPHATALVARALSRATLTPEDSRRLVGEINTYLDQVLTRPDAGGGESLLADLRDATRSGGISHEEARDTLWLFLGAGFDTTVGALVNTVHALLSRPARLARVRDENLPWEAVAEEALRYDSAVFSLPFAFPRHDVTLGGQRLRQGDALLLCYLAANRDPRRLADADRFRVTAAREPHLAFGRGPHFCLGAPLARLQMHTALEKLFTRFPALRLAGSPGSRTPSLIVNSFSALHVTVDGAGGAAGRP